MDDKTLTQPAPPKKRRIELDLKNLLLYFANILIFLNLSYKFFGVLGFAIIIIIALVVLLVSETRKPANNGNFILNQTLYSQKTKLFPILDSSKCVLAHENYASSTEESSTLGRFTRFAVSADNADCSTIGRFEKLRFNLALVLFNCFE